MGRNTYYHSWVRGAKENCLETPVAKAEQVQKNKVRKHDT